MKNEKIKLIRMEMNISQEQLAASVKAAKHTIGMIEAGEFNPSLKLCIAISRALAVTLNDLFWDEE